MHKCYYCGYYRNNYCNDLDCEIDDPNEPICSEENYNS